MPRPARSVVPLSLPGELVLSIQALPTRPVASPQGRTWQTLLLLGVAIAALLGLGYALLGPTRRTGSAPPVAPTLDEIPIDGRRAMRYLEQICALGPRPSGSPAMTRQQQLVTAHFTAQGAEVKQQRFRIRHPLDGSPVTMTNLWARFHPQRRERVILAAHYDTRPYPDRDPVDPRGAFVGANDGASGVALLMELSHWLPELQGPVGVDLVLFDGEEFVFRDEDRYFYGSEYFARMFVQDPPRAHYRAAVVLDMIGDADLQIYREQFSLRWPSARPIIDGIWQTAARLGVREFVPKTGYEIRDDHLALYQIAGIPSCDLIDFDYPSWHTRDDTPEKCSAESLAKVGWVVWEWLKAPPASRPRGRASGAD